MTTTAAEFDRRTAIESLRSDVCPACGNTKTPRKSVCTICWHKLPRNLSRSLYTAFTDGYLDHLNAALVYLHAQR